MFKIIHPGHLVNDDVQIGFFLHRFNNRLIDGSVIQSLTQKQLFNPKVQQGIGLSPRMQTMTADKLHHKLIFSHKIV